MAMTDEERPVGKQLFTLHSYTRARVKAAIDAAPDGYVVEIKEKTRTLEQNAKLWAMLTEIAEQVEWHGRYLSPESWKHIFTAALSKQDVVPGIDGDFVVLGKSTSRMSKREFSDLVELIYAFGAEHSVVFSDPVPHWMIA